MLSEHKTLRISLIVAVLLCVFPVIGFVLYALWPVRVLVAWLLLGTIGLVVVVWLILWSIRVMTQASVAAQEEALRPGRLYANERLVGQEAGYHQMPMQQQHVYQQSYEQSYMPYPDDRSVY